MFFHTHIYYKLQNCRCHISRVACHMSLTSTATATDPPPSNSPTMHSMLVHKDPKSLKISKPKTIIETDKKKHSLEVCQYQQYALWPEVSNSNSWGVINDYARLERQKDPQTYIVTTRLNWPQADSVNTQIYLLKILQTRDTESLDVSG